MRPSFTTADGVRVANRNRIEDPIRDHERYVEPYHAAVIAYFDVVTNDLHREVGRAYVRHALGLCAKCGERKVKLPGSGRPQCPSREHHVHPRRDVTRMRARLGYPSRGA